MLTQRLISGVCAHGIKEEYLSQPREVGRSTPPSTAITIRDLRSNIGQDSVESTTPEPQITEWGYEKRPLPPASTEPSSVTSTTSSDPPAGSPDLYSSPGTGRPETSDSLDPRHDSEVSCVRCYLYIANDFTHRPILTPAHPLFLVPLRSIPLYPLHLHQRLQGEARLRHQQQPLLLRLQAQLPLRAWPRLSLGIHQSPGTSLTTRSMTSTITSR